MTESEVLPSPLTSGQRYAARPAHCKKIIRAAGRTEAAGKPGRRSIRGASTAKFSMTAGTSGVYGPPVPEPTTLGVLALAGLAFIRRRRRL